MTNEISVAARILAAMGSLTVKEKLVARTVLAQYPASGLEPSAELAHTAGVSTPTVVRFVARLGYSGYKDFQAELRTELAERTASASVLENRISGSAGGSETDAAQILTTAVQQTFALLPNAEVERAVDVLTRARAVLTLGGRFSHVLAEYAALNLRALRPGVRFLSSTADAEVASTEAGRGDALLVVDVRRYQQDTVTLARLFQQRRASVVLLTDPWLSPIAEFASAVLSAKVEAPSPMDSLVAPMAVIETLVAGVHRRLGPAAADRLDINERAATAVAGRR